MAEKQIKIHRMFITHYLCDSCSDGEMVPDKTIVIDDPEEYFHKCYNCEEKQKLPKLYRTLRYCSLDYPSLESVYSLYDECVNAMTILPLNAIYDPFYKRLTATINGKLDFINGVKIMSGDLILVAQQIAPEENGIYEIESIGSNSQKWKLNKINFNGFDSETTICVIGESHSYDIENWDEFWKTKTYIIVTMNSDKIIAFCSEHAKEVIVNDVFECPLSAGFDDSIEAFSYKSKELKDKLPYSAVLISEFVGSEDLDGNNKVYGYDFKITNGPEKPADLDMLENRNDWDSDNDEIESITWEEYLNSI